MSFLCWHVPPLPAAIRGPRPNLDKRSIVVFRGDTSRGANHHGYQTGVQVGRQLDLNVLYTVTVIGGRTEGWDVATSEPGHDERMEGATFKGRIVHITWVMHD